MVIMCYLLLPVLLYFILRKEYSRSDSIIYAYVFMSGGIFLLINFLSFIEMYNKNCMVFAWIICFIISSFVLYRNHTKINRNIQFKKPTIANPTYFFWTIIFIVLAVCLIRALIWPPQNVDSLVYHLPRAFYFYKNKAVSNIPSSYIVTNYTAPANAILISHLLKLMDGNDILVNLIQFPSAICLCIATIQICKELNISDKLSVLGGMLTLSIPLVILEAVTTQNDLLAANYVVLSMLFVIRLYKDQTIEGKKDIFLWLGLGICVGSAVYSKITAGLALLPVLILFGTYCIYRKNITILNKLFFASVLGFFINFPYWYRNFVDWNGDFLALKASSYLSSGGELGITDFLGRVVLNIGYSCCGKVPGFNSKILSICRYIYFMIGADECKDFSKYRIYGLANHDYTPYGGLLIFAFICAILMVVNKSFSQWSRIYAGISLVSILLSALFIPVSYFMPSATRYLLPAACLLYINILLWLYEYNRNRKKREICNFFIFICVIISFFNIVITNIYDNSQPVIIQNRLKYEDRRDIKYWGKSWNPTRYEFTEILKDFKIYNIGIYEQSLSGIYPMLHEIASKEYNVKSIYGEYAMDYLDKTFIPEAIIYISNEKEIKGYIEYNGNRYDLYSIGNELSWNNGVPYLFLIHPYTTIE